MIRFVPIDEKNYNESFKLSVFDHQRSFVASNERSLAQAYIYRNDVEPYAIYEDAVMVGFMQIIPEEDDPKCLYLWRFMIDQNHQKKGYGKAALLQLIDMAKTRNKYETLKLSVEPENAVAIHLYESIGFKANGVIDDGEAEMVLPLTMTNSL